MTLKLTVGEPSGSHSERWILDIFEDPSGRAVYHHCDDGFGTPGWAEYALVKGKAYTFKVRWVATNLYDENGNPAPDYDWQAEINDSVEEGLREGLYNTGVFVVEDSDDLPTEYTDGNESNLTVDREGKIYVCSVELLSDKAFNSPKAFEYSIATLPSPCGQDMNDPDALVVYYNEVFNYQTKQVNDFDVRLRVLPIDLQGVTWSKVDGPDSGTLINNDQTEATFENPKKGGVYCFDGVIDDRTTRTQLWHPTAAPEIRDWVEDEINYMHSWVANYKANAGVSRKIPILGKGFRVLDLYSFGITLDWAGYFTGDTDPCCPSQAAEEAVANPRHTICGIVLDRYHLSNLLTAYLTRDMTGWSEDRLLWQFNKAGNPDDQYDIASYRIGFAVFNGSTLQEAMNLWGYPSQEPDTGNWTLKLWPSENTPTGGQIHRPQALQ